ncbi:MAG: ABC transporter permease [Lachnospiraceae bacterium]|nr:ABC transporter permease [Lachnospiraceae bacterium]
MNVFTRTTIKTLQKNKTRTLVTIIGIILATAMLTAVTTFISSLQNYMTEAVIYQMGDWQGALYHLGTDKVEEIQNSDEVAKACAFQMLGYANRPGTTNENISQTGVPYLFLMGLSKESQEMLPIRLRAGRMPENNSELIVSSAAITSGKSDIEIGDTFDLEIGKRWIIGEEPREELTLYNPLIKKVEEGSSKDSEIGEELIPEETRTYTVVGIIETPRFVDLSNPAYYAATLADEIPKEGSRYACYFKLYKSSEIYKFTEEHMEGMSYATYNSELLRYQGVSKNRPFMRMLYGLSSILILLIMTGGISLVYNSFAISVSDRTRQFGLLASTGATPRQLRGMVFREAFLVSAVGIPVGILSGIIGIGITLHFTGRSFYYLYDSEVLMHLHVSWPAVLIAGATALITVLISAWIPSRRAARISPMEAIRQSGDIRVPRKIVRKGKLSYRFFGLEGMVARKHFSRNKKQYRATIFSLFISIVLFISASSFSSYVRSSITTVHETPENDISMYIEDVEKEGALEKVQERVRNIEGVDRMVSIQGVNMDVPFDPEQITEDYRALLDTEDRDTSLGKLYREDGKLMLYDSRILIVEDKAYEEYVEELGLPKEEYLGSDTKKVIVLNQVQGYIQKEQRFRLYDILKTPGEDIEMLLTDYTAMRETQEKTGEEQSREDFQSSIKVTIGTFAEKAPMNLYAEWGGGFSVILSKGMFERLAGKENFCLQGAQLYIQAENHREVAERLETLSLDGSFDSYFFVIDEAESRQTYRSMLLTVDVFTYGFITLISLIAVANVFNTISTGVLLRRKELAVLSSVGMTPKGMRRMLNYECILYGSKALLYGLPVSLFITWQIYGVVHRSMDTNFYIPAASILIAVSSVFLVVFATMLYARSRLKGENIIDSIRQESV